MTNPTGIEYVQSKQRPRSLILTHIRGLYLAYYAFINDIVAIFVSGRTPCNTIFVHTTNSASINNGV
jgi:hypothetical protein